MRIIPLVFSWYELLYNIRISALFVYVFLRQLRLTSVSFPVTFRSYVPAFGFSFRSSFRQLVVPDFRRFFRLSRHSVSFPSKKLLARFIQSGRHSVV